MTEILLGIGALVLGPVGIALTLAGLPGTWFLVALAAVTVLFDDTAFSMGTLIAMVVIALLAEVAEFAAGAAGASKAGGSKRAALAAVVGGIVGAICGTFMIPIPIAGTILGAAIGSGVAATGAHLTKEGETVPDAARVGAGAFTGRLLATVVKSVFALAIWIVLVVAAFAP